jgi:thiol:disulfide interchange protein DsbC
MFNRLLATALCLFCVGTTAAADSTTELIRGRMAKLFPADEVTSVAPAPVAGLYEVMLGASLFYMSEDGRYVVRGDLIDLDSKVNISDQRRALARELAFKGLDSDDLITFLPASGEVRETLYVYTDIDCGYCRKMHLEVDELNSAGIAVSYLAFPRSGLQGESFDKAAAVWCSANRQEALTAAKAGKKVSAETCDSPVAAQFELGRSMGVSGTPAVYTAAGQQLGGYVPAKDLIKLVE